MSQKYTELVLWNRFPSILGFCEHLLGTGSQAGKGVVVTTLGVPNGGSQEEANKAFGFGKSKEPTLRSLGGKGCLHGDILEGPLTMT